MRRLRAKERGRRTATRRVRQVARRRGSVRRMIRPLKLRRVAIRMETAVRRATARRTCSQLKREVLSAGVCLLLEGLLRAQPLGQPATTGMRVFQWRGKGHGLAPCDGTS